MASGPNDRKLSTAFQELGVRASNGGTSKEHDASGGEKSNGHFRVEQCGHDNGGAAHVESVSAARASRPAKRPFCERCRKAQKLCICSRFKGVVDNKIRITILQHPEEKNHPISSARIALLGLRNVGVITVPEFDSNISYRIRPKVPGSKRSIARRGGRRMLLQEGTLKTKEPNASELEASGVNGVLNQLFEGLCLDGFTTGKQQSFGQPEDVSARENENFGMDCFRAETPPLTSCKLEKAIPSGVALLYPSEKAVDLSFSEFVISKPPQDGGMEIKCSGVKILENYPNHLIVLDGTWSKAKRIYFENPWLQNIPHYKLPAAFPSLYEGVRKQPKPGCLSTLESIIYALKMLEPQTEGLDGLMEVFDSMVEDQRRCKQTRLFTCNSDAG